MLVYEKKVDDERHLYGTLGSVPSDSDQPLIYKDNEGGVITPTLSDGFKDNGKGGIKDIAKDCEVNVFIGDTCIIPPGVEPVLPGTFSFKTETISFEIGNNTYEADIDMVWDDWLYSDYNTDGYKKSESSENIVNSDESKCVSLEDTTVKSSDTISEGTKYILVDF